MDDALLDKVAFINERFMQVPVRGLILRFSGLGATGMRNDVEPMELEWGRVGGLSITPYHDPWAWMNLRTRNFVDELVAGLMKRYKLGDSTPIIAIGPSMGGHAALAYSMLAKTKVTACMANCPVCDLPFHYTERVDLPRTMHHAYDSYGPIDEALATHSPLHQVAKLPKIPYLIVHGGKDLSVNKQKHSDRLVAAMKERGLSVNYVEVPEMGHCSPLDYPTYATMRDFVLKQFGQS